MFKDSFIVSGAEVNLDSDTSLWIPYVSLMDRGSLGKGTHSQMARPCPPISPGRTAELTKWIISDREFRVVQATVPRSAARKHELVGERSHALGKFTAVAIAVAVAVAVAAAAAIAVAFNSYWYDTKYSTVLLLYSCSCTCWYCCVVVIVVVVVVVVVVVKVPTTTSIYS
ncbi:hypothetical protein M0802_004872 [Mischocyttarus mexicanus]|nr:hypothetical protein M0802_004872 [Mischocyttarus mexicanus]